MNAELETEPVSDAGGTLHNFTRKSESIGRKLWRRRRFVMLLKYGLMRLSDLGREGIENSGSFRFADHIYRNKPSGQGMFGKMIDRKLLRMPASQAFRRRYLFAQDVVKNALEKCGDHRLRVLAIPCGIPRDVGELSPELRLQIDYTAADLNPEVLKAAGAYLADKKMASTRFQLGDALNPATFADAGGEFDVILCTGLGEFLDDAQLAKLYTNVHGALAPGGTFYTSATDLDPKSEALLRAMELETNYRDQEALERIFSATGKRWGNLCFSVDPSGLQTFVRAVR